MDPTLVIPRPRSFEGRQPEARNQQAAALFQAAG